MDLKKYIRSIPDYPKKGILFRDITTLINNKDAFKYTVDQFVKIASKINKKQINQILNQVINTYNKAGNVYLMANGNP